jgi:hypothetical protein
MPTVAADQTIWPYPVIGAESAAPAHVAQPHCSVPIVLTPALPISGIAAAIGHAPIVPNRSRLVGQR